MPRRHRMTQPRRSAAADGAIGRLCFGVQRRRTHRVRRALIDADMPISAPLVISLVYLSFMADRRARIAGMRGARLVCLIKYVDSHLP